MKDCRPFGAALRGVASNRPLLRWLNTVVVSDEGKGVPDTSGGGQEGRATDKVVSAGQAAGSRRRRAWSRWLSYLASRRVAAMSLLPCWRMTPSWALRRVARLAGRLPTRTLEESSRRVVSLTQ